MQTPLLANYQSDLLPTSTKHISVDLLPRRGEGGTTLIRSWSFRGHAAKKHHWRGCTTLIRPQSFRGYADKKHLTGGGAPP